MVQRQTPGRSLSGAALFSAGEDVFGNHLRR
ncbi:Oligopeptide transport system permease protein OppB [Caballeronia sordidicola]|uniref:Oligopeptide transport system permease protein OppB n=1 Tax=Caballeronia sordidicola TaxID=196367 RepID=A0A242NAD9_CABSO|nr:Oligopeptide transport system permease protein OppB [Caballeronia sordidicola]OTP80663.1 Oligopeptide transport system permease protein OppB [Caballeronia sordidicola]